MNGRRRLTGRSRSPLVGLVATVLSASGTGSVEASGPRFVALDADGEPLIVEARDATAAASGDLLGDAADEWIAARPGGDIVVRAGHDGSLRGVADLPARALAVANRSLVVALQHGGLLELDVGSGAVRPVGPWIVNALAAVDIDGDGLEEVAAAVEGGGLLLLGGGGAEARRIDVAGGVALAGADLLGLGRDQLAVRRASGEVEVVDVRGSESTRCFAGVAGGSGPGDAAGSGISALPPGGLLVAEGGSPLQALDPVSCELFEVDLTSLEVRYERVFTVWGAPSEPPPRPPCPVVSVDCAPVPGADALDVAWEVRRGDGCVCERFEVRSPDGALLAEADGKANGVVVPCVRLGQTSSLTVVCIGADGGESTGGCDFEPCDLAGGGQRPGDCNQDGALDISDAVCLLGHLFLGSPAELPCGDGTAPHPANTSLLDSNGDDGIDLSDPVYVLAFLFLGERPPVLGRSCVTIPACPDVCAD